MNTPTTKVAVSAVVMSYLCWGFFGLYFKALDHVSPLEILAHRVFWSVLLLTAILTYWRKWHHVVGVLRDWKKARLFLASAFLISINWGVYIYAVVSGQALEGSMGYFIMPLVAIILGAAFLSERFNRIQTFSIGLAVIGVAYQVINYAQLPLIALTLALSFGIYGLLRKQSAIDSVTGLFIETLFISPIAIGAMIYWGVNSELAFIQLEWVDRLLLILAGPVTALPLILFAYGAKGLRYSTVGLLQYINPSCQFLIALFVFVEPFSLNNLITFGFIWAALALYSTNVYLQSRQQKAT